MTRHHLTAEGLIPFTPEEEAEWDALDAEWPLRLAQIVRLDRNRRLVETDWSQLADVPQPVKDKYTEYRQALRNVPQQDGFPDNIIWPIKPE